MEEVVFSKWSLLSSPKRWWLPQRRQGPWSFNGLLPKLAYRVNPKHLPWRKRCAPEEAGSKQMTRHEIKTVTLKTLKTNVTIQNINNTSSQSKIKRKF